MPKKDLFHEPVKAPWEEITITVSSDELTCHICGQPDGVSYGRESYWYCVSCWVLHQEGGEGESGE